MAVQELAPLLVPPTPRVVEGTVLTALTVPQPRQGSGLIDRIVERTEAARRVVEVTIHRLRYRPAGRRTARMAVLIPAHDEQDDIEACLASVLAQTRVPDLVVVIADNCTDDTVALARRFRGVKVIETSGNTDAKVGALATGYGEFIAGGAFDVMVSMDADVELEPNCLADLEAELLKTPSAAAVSAKYHFAEGTGGWFNRQLVRAQKMDFTQFQMRANERGRRTTIVGGQCSAFRFSAVDEVVRTHRRPAPWTNETATEDAQLGLELQELGWTTVMSTTARAQVGAMPTLRALSGQRSKWNAGLIALMTGTPLSKRTLPFWLQHIGLGLNMLMRVAFVCLLAASLAVHQFVWSWWWLTPTVLAAVYQLKMAHLAPRRTTADYLFAALWLPGEAWLWFSGWNTTKAWVTHLRGRQRDLWAAQAAAERGVKSGNGSGALLGTFVAAVAASSVGAWYWLTQASVTFQRVVLTVGWRSLAVLTVLATILLVVKILRPTRGLTA
ncbi:glycosyltransferase family 2 protein [Kineococcus rhizosphaerae]|uniref:Cellulose synthase/poly-beta-1,6-N-acetylglucosamine synthase-like glycosyltransferase n=1 Tax=Kineococcus rhizosphaerae TaxID=559628 RepID=A0A2T0QXP5_9ACTN|nr:glycosyltransferase family 2 protein [Kineococcus rhizosphaerae]PRY10808.1 cellulose synthase/poly-beta-1,6-N-acetylglucosamine synthase-like glycosyltransferase [Kineococcus rhizosphaerae]